MDAGCVVYKYALTEETTLELPRGACPLSAGFQGHDVQLWVLVPIGQSVVKDQRRFRIAGTGEPLPLGGAQYRYIGTAVWQERIVAHVFEVV